MKRFAISLMTLLGVGFTGTHSNTASAADSSKWDDVGKATFMDGWLLPAFGMDQTKESNWYEVALQQSSDNENLYRLVDPYHAGPLAEYNQSASIGYIEFDVSDPKHVVVNWNLVQAGFSNSELGITEFYCYNTLTYFGSYLYKGYSPEEIVEAVGNQMAYTTFEDGVVTLGKYNDPDPEFGYSYYDAKYGLQNSVIAGKNWTNALGMPSNMTTKIFFPDASAVEKVEIPEESGAVYYDMSGFRVDNPVPGQMYIVKRGSNAEKVVIR